MQVQRSDEPMDRSVLAAHFDRADEDELNDEDALFDPAPANDIATEAQKTSDIVEDDKAADTVSIPENIDADTSDSMSENIVADASEPEPEAELNEADLRSQIRNLLGDTGLADVDEDDLIGELASIEKDALGKRASKGNKVFAALTDNTDDTAARLMETAHSELVQQDALRRRDAFEHMRVAVDATRADEEISGPRRRDLANEREIELYRENMEIPELLEPAAQRASETGGKTRSSTASEPTPDPVRDHPSTEEAVATVPEQPAPEAAEPARPFPRRPAPIARGQSQRPDTGRAPLVLVSEQRIDTPAAKGPVRPRRVKSAANTPVDLTNLRQPGQDIADDMKSFKEFATRVDAWLLDEQIEAAAAYATHMKGQDAFSRVELMNYVIAFNEGKAVSRDDMLRGFGTLLREGRLERAEGGAFRLSSGSEFDEPARQQASR